jgi:hypothetical protein
MGEYIYTLRGPSKNVKVNINGQIESVALLSFHYKPIHSFWDKEPRWQILAKARCERMDNLWQSHGLPKYVVHVFIHDNGKIDFEGARITDWNVGGSTISDGSTVYDKLKTVGFLAQKSNGVWDITDQMPRF